MDRQELRLRLIEAAGKVPHNTNPLGHAVGVVETAKLWESWIVTEEKAKTLGLPKVGK